MKTVTVPSDDPDTPVVSLKISANIEITLGFTPPLLSLGDVEPGQTITRSLELIGKQSAGVNVVGATARRQIDVALEPRDRDGKRAVLRRARRRLVR